MVSPHRFSYMAVQAHREYLERKSKSNEDPIQIELQGLNRSKKPYAVQLQESLQTVLETDSSKLEDRDIVHVLAYVVEERPNLSCDDVKNLSQKIESVKSSVDHYDTQVLKNALEYFYRTSATEPR